MSEPWHIHKTGKESIVFEVVEPDYHVGRCEVCGHWIVIREDKSGQHMRQTNRVEEMLANELWLRGIRDKDNM